MANSYVGVPLPHPPPHEGWRYHLGEILDPPLVTPLPTPGVGALSLGNRSTSELHIFVTQNWSLLFRQMPWFLPPANEVCEGYVFTGVCLSTRGGGRAWLLPGGLHGIRRDTEIRSMSGRYASYWNAFLFLCKICDGLCFIGFFLFYTRGLCKLQRKLLSSMIAPLRCKNSLLIITKSCVAEIIFPKAK